MDENTTNSRLDDVLGGVTRDRRMVEDSLRAKIASIRRTMDRVEAALDADLHLNSLGELQSEGPGFDRLCSERSKLIEIQQALRWAAKVD
jgi:hypothetical protein